MAVGNVPDLGYEAYARLPFAKGVVRWGVGLAGIQPGDTVLDIGTGTGDSAAAILDVLSVEGQCQGRVVAIEPNERSLAVARERLAGRPVEFFEAAAQDLDRLGFRPGEFRAAVWSNGIHYLESEELLHRALVAIRGVTAERFSAWSTFVKGAYDGLTTRFAGLWVLKAYEILGVGRERRERSQNLRERGREDYLQALLAAGFAAADGFLERFELGPEVWEAIAAFGDYAGRALPSREIALGTRSEALVRAVRPIFDRLGVSAVPRNWLFLSATV